MGCLHQHCNQSSLIRHLHTRLISALLRGDLDLDPDRGVLDRVICILIAPSVLGLLGVDVPNLPDIDILHLPDMMAVGVPSLAICSHIGVNQFPSIAPSLVTYQF